jgi:hypothetical protein
VSATTKDQQDPAHTTRNPVAQAKELLRTSSAEHRVPGRVPKLQRGASNVTSNAMALENLPPLALQVAHDSVIVQALYERGGAPFHSGSPSLRVAI